MQHRSLERFTLLLGLDRLEQARDIVDALHTCQQAQLGCIDAPQRTPRQTLLGVLDAHQRLVLRIVADGTTPLFGALLLHVHRPAERHERRRGWGHLEVLEPVGRKHLGVACLVMHLHFRRRRGLEAVLPQHAESGCPKRIRVLGNARLECGVFLLGHCLRIEAIAWRLFERRRTRRLPLDPATLAAQHGEQQRQILASVVAGVPQLRLHMPPRTPCPFFVCLREREWGDEQLVRPRCGTLAARVRAPQKELEEDEELGEDVPAELCVAQLVVQHGFAGEVFWEKRGGVCVDPRALRGMCIGTVVLLQHGQDAVGHHLEDAHRRFGGLAEMHRDGRLGARHRDMLAFFKQTRRVRKERLQAPKQGIKVRVRGVGFCRARRVVRFGVGRVDGFDGRLVFDMEFTFQVDTAALVDREVGRKEREDLTGQHRVRAVRLGQAAEQLVAEAQHHQPLARIRDHALGQWLGARLHVGEQLGARGSGRALHPLLQCRGRQRCVGDAEALERKGDIEARCDLLHRALEGKGEHLGVHGLCKHLFVQACGAAVALLRGAECVARRLDDVTQRLRFARDTRNRIVRVCVGHRLQLRQVRVESLRHGLDGRARCVRHAGTTRTT